MSSTVTGSPCCALLQAILRDLEELSGEESYYTTRSTAAETSSGSDEGTAAHQTSVKQVGRRQGGSRTAGHSAAQSDRTARNSRKRARSVPDAEGDGPDLLQLLPLEIMMDVLQQLAPPEW